jgi:6-phosphofructokinase 1
LNSGRQPAKVAPQTHEEAAMPTKAQLIVKTLGERRFPSPLNLSTIPDDDIADYMPDRARVLLNAESMEGETPDTSLMFEKAGPREAIFFEPSKTRAAIVTCGGLCPGLNNVIRSMVLELRYHYRVSDVLGFRYGYRGLGPNGLPPMALTPDAVRDIHRTGGSMLGTSRGAESPAAMVDTLVKNDVQILFCVGGDGTLKGAHAIDEEITRRGLRIAVVGVPKTIDNDVCYIDKTFGFDTAVEMARVALDGAHTEANSAYHGVGLVKVMGRDSGFIAAAATLASLEVNFCLVPEVHFDLDGPSGLFAALQRRLDERQHALIVVAEGCSRVLMTQNVARDASGNVNYQSTDLDIGAHLRDVIVQHFKALGRPVTLKYIDPSYMIRSVPANANDSIFCDILARHAVHAGMAGKTDVVIGRWHSIFTHVPISLATASRKQIDPDSGLWLAVSETTGQPSLSNIPVSKRPAMRR